MRLLGRTALGLAAFLSLVGQASAASTFGPDLTTGTAGTTYSCASLTYSSGSGATQSSQCNTVLVSVGGVNQTSPITGVLVGFKIRMSTQVSGHLRIMRGANGNPVTGALSFQGIGPDVAVPGDGSVHTYPLQMPIEAGDQIAFGTIGSAVYRNVAGSNARIVKDTTDGTTPPEANNLAAGTRDGLQAPFAGIVEPDADNDGFGDETQDHCPGAFGAFSGCPPDDQLVVELAGAGSGVVKSAGGEINCGSECLHSYPAGTTVALTAAAAPGSTFAGWSGGGCSGTGKCTLTLNSDESVTATFELIGGGGAGGGGGGGGGGDQPPSGQPPTTKLTMAQVHKRSATFRFTAGGSSTGFQCALHKKGKRAKFTGCRSPKRYGNLAEGRYTFEVRAVGADGDDATPAKRSFRI